MSVPRVSRFDVDVTRLAGDSRRSLHVFCRHRVGLGDARAVECASLAEYRMKLEHPAIAVRNRGCFQID